MDEFCVLYTGEIYVKMRLMNDSRLGWGTNHNGIPLQWQPWQWHPLPSLMTMEEAGDKILRIDSWTLCDQRQAMLCMRMLPALSVALIQILQEYACRTIEDCKEGDYVDALDPNDAWFLGKICILHHRRQTARIHFFGWDTSDDETIPLTSRRIAPPGSKTKTYSGVDILVS